MIFLDKNVTSLDDDIMRINQWCYKYDSGEHNKLAKESKTSIIIWPRDILLFVVKDERLTTKIVLKWHWGAYIKDPSQYHLTNLREFY